ARSQRGAAGGGARAHPEGDTDVRQVLHPRCGSCLLGTLTASDCVSEVYPWTGQKAKAPYRAAAIAKAHQIVQARSHVRRVVPYWGADLVAGLLDGGARLGV